jgi:hypothetical protein
MKNGTRILAMAAVLAAGAMAESVAWAADLAVWDSTGAQSLAGSFAATTKADGLTVSNLTAGSGLLLTGSQPAGNAFLAGGYDKTSAETAMTAGDWWETCLDAGANGIAPSLLQYYFRASGSGPKKAQWAWSTDRSSWHYLGTEETINDKWVERTAVDLSGVPDANRLWLRMVAWNGGAANNAWGGFGQKTVVLRISGEVLSSEGEPTVGFIPASPWTYVGETLVVTVKARPAGAKVTSMTVSPTPKGTVTPNLSAGTWTFKPANGDSNTTFQLKATVSNAYGTAEGTVDVRVKGKVTSGTLTIDFEGVTGDQTSWNGATLSLPAGSGTNWVLEGSIVRNGNSSDRKNENGALVFTKDGPGSIRSQEKVLDKGIGKISYCYGVNTNYLDEGRPVLRTLVSEDGEFWVEADAADTAELGGDGELAERSFDVGVGVPVYLEFRCDGFSGSAQVNLDDVVIQPKAAGNPYEQILLKFNVTPGDPGTDSSQDLDADGSSNSKDANPYDPDVQ